MANVTNEFKVVGKSHPRMESADLVTGKAKFVNDMKAELYGKILRSPLPHAKIKSIDVSKALELEGVKAVITHKDVPNRLMPRANGRACLVLEDKVRFVGDEVAAVAATSRMVAEEALDLIKVEYEELKPVFHPRAAAREDAPKIYPEGNVYGPQYGALVEKGIQEPGIIEWGNVEEGFKSADVVVERSIESEPEIHAPIETHVCIAEWKDDELKIWISSQRPHEVHDAVTHVLDIPDNKVRVFTQHVGGGFGSKYVERYVPIAALLSKKAGGQSVKIVNTIEEELTHVKRGLSSITVKIGAKKDGTITALMLEAFCDIGGYGNPISGTCALGTLGIPNENYSAENGRFLAWDVHTNHFSTQAFRSVNIPSQCLAIEQAIDELAKKLNMDSIEFRMKNIPHTGDIIPKKPVIKGTSISQATLEYYPAKELLEDIADKIGWKEKRGKGFTRDGTKKRGVGIAYSAGWGMAFAVGETTMVVYINRDGTATVLTGTQDIGTGSNTAFRMIAAEELGLEFDEVSIKTGDTSFTPHDHGAIASRTLATGGILLIRAVQDAKDKIRAMVSKELGVNPENIEVIGKSAFDKNHPENKIVLSQFLESTIVGSATGSGFLIAKPGTKQRQAMVVAAEVEVDAETGEVKVIKMVTGGTCGRMINPEVVRGQYIGGAVQGIGEALFEKFVFDEKALAYKHKTFTDYKIPTSLDVPEIIAAPMEAKGKQRSDTLPYGAFGVGEMGNCLMVPAISDAIHDAIGVRVSECPFTPELILEALEGKKNE